MKQLNLLQITAAAASSFVLAGPAQALDAVASPPQQPIIGPLPIIGPKAGPNLVQDGDRWIATAYDDASASHAPLLFGNKFKSAVYCFRYEGTVGTHDRYSYYSPTFPTLAGKATQEGDHVVMHGDFGIALGNPPIVISNVGHEAANWNLVTEKTGTQGTGDYTTWFETDRPTRGQTLAFANIRFERSGYCRIIRDLSDDFRIERGLEPLVPMTGPVEEAIAR